MKHLDIDFPTVSALAAACKLAAGQSANKNRTAPADRLNSELKEGAEAARQAISDKTAT